MADLDLARRAVKAAGWKQPGGQLRDDAGVMWRPSDMSDWDAGGAGDPLPDLDDPATLGCLLALVRERHPHACTNFGLSVARINDKWVHMWRVEATGLLLGSGCTEAEALVAALEAGVSDE